MKLNIPRTLHLFLLVLFLGAASCTSGWDSESQDMFYQSCMDNAKERGLDQDKAASVCDCRLETIMKKYPTLSNAMENIDKILVDEDLKNCE